MRTLPLLMLALSVLAVSAACSGGSAPFTASSQQFSTAVFSGFLLWEPTSDGAPGGANAVTGDAIIATVPFDASGAGGANDIGALRNQAAFFLAGGEVSAAEIASLRGQPLSWSISNSTATLASAPPVTPPPSAPPGSLTLPSHYVMGAKPGVGTLSVSVQNAPVPIVQTAKVVTYPVVDVGCVDVGALPGVSFATDGSYTAQSLGTGGDLYVTGPTCSSQFGDFASAYTIHAPYGATLLSTGPIAQSNGLYYSDEQPPNFTQIGPSSWASDFTSIDEATFDADVSPPCTVVTETPAPLPSGATNPFAPITGCIANPDDVMLLKTQSGAIVKLYMALSHDGTTSGRNIVGAYEVTNASGAFPY